MFASQWFLTLYTAKFPLLMVFRYLDMFLLTGFDSVFRIALAMLTVSWNWTILKIFSSTLTFISNVKLYILVNDFPNDKLFE